MDFIFYTLITLAIIFNIYLLFIKNDKVEDKDEDDILVHNDENNTYDTMLELKNKNDILENFEDIVQNNKAIVIISENGAPKSNRDDIAVILAELFAWKEAWTKSDLDRYIGFYHSDFRRFDGMKLAEFTQMKKRIFSKNESKIIEFQNFNITPYPNTDDKNIYRVNFSEKYRADSYKFNGDKTLYVEVADNKMKILVEE